MAFTVFPTGPGGQRNGDGARGAFIAACAIVKRKVILSSAALSQMFFGPSSRAYTEIESTQASDNGPKDRLKREFAKRMDTMMADYELGIEERKRKLFEKVIPTGATVVEVGIGAGPNLRYMPREVTVVGVEPNRHMWQYSTARARELGVQLKIHEGVAERLPLKDASADVFVSTLTLCSVQSPAAALAEAARVLRPGGTLVFIEHVHAPRSRPLLRLVQNILDPIKRDMRDGCRFTQDTEGFIRDAVASGAFENMNVDRFDAHFDCFFMGPLRPQIAGFAKRTDFSPVTASDSLQD